VHVTKPGSLPGLLISILSSNIKIFKDSKIKEKRLSNIQYTAQDTSMRYQQEEQNKEEVKIYPKEEILKEYKGYKVAAKLEIPKIELETYILSTYSEKSLNLSVTKFWGADPNRIGNCCIAGHHAQNKNMFHNLRNLEAEDNLWIIDKDIGRVEYEIYDIYTVPPEDVKCLSQETRRKTRNNINHLH